MKDTSVIIKELISGLNGIPKGCDLSDIGNMVGIVVGKHIDEDIAGYQKCDFEHGLRHGFSLADGTH